MNYLWKNNSVRILKILSLRVLDDSEKDSEFVAVESKTYFQDAWGRFKKNKLALVSLVFMAVVILFAVFAPMFHHIHMMVRI